MSDEAETGRQPAVSPLKAFRVMKWMPRLIVLFIVLPAVELSLLLQFHRWTSFWATVALILGTGLLGSYLVRREGTAAWRRLQQKLGSAALPGTELVDGVIILVAGALLITPGLLTDAFGLLGLFPSTRAFARRMLLKRIMRSRARGTMGFHVVTPFEAPPSADGWKGQAEASPRHARD